MKNQVLSKRLKSLREEKGYLQKHVADKIGVRSNTLSGYENGTRTPDPSMIISLADLYNVTTDYLLGKTDHTYITEDDKKTSIIKEMEELMRKNPDAELMFENFSELTVDQLEEVADFVRFKLQKKD